MAVRMCGATHYTICHLSKTLPMIYAQPISRGGNGGVNAWVCPSHSSLLDCPRTPTRTDYCHIEGQARKSPVLLPNRNSPGGGG